MRFAGTKLCSIVTANEPARFVRAMLQSTQIPHSVPEETRPCCCAVPMDSRLRGNDGAVWAVVRVFKSLRFFGEVDALLQPRFQPFADFAHIGFALQARFQRAHDFAHVAHGRGTGCGNRGIDFRVDFRCG